MTLLEYANVSHFEDRASRRRAPIWDDEMQIGNSNDIFIPESGAHKPRLSGNLFALTKQFMQFLGARLCPHTLTFERPGRFARLAENPFGARLDMATASLGYR